MESPSLLFGLEETGAADYRTPQDCLFLRELDARAKAYPWYGDGWSRDDRTIVSVCLIESGVLRTTLRIDFFGDSLHLGYDTTHQLVEDLDLADATTEIIHGISIPEMANMAADWIEARIQTFNDSEA